MGWEVRSITKELKTLVEIDPRLVDEKGHIKAEKERLLERLASVERHRSALQSEIKKLKTVLNQQIDENEKLEELVSSLTVNIQKEKK